MSDITANVVIGMPSQLFTLARSFKANANGKIYISKIDTPPGEMTDPDNYVQVYLENEDGSHVPMAQPIIINAGGYPVYNGQTAKFVTVEGHAMAVYNSYNVQEFYYPNVLKYDPDQLRQELQMGDGSLIGLGNGKTLSELKTSSGGDMVGVLPSGNVNDIISYVTPEMFGTDSSDYDIQSAINNSGRVELSKRQYSISTSLNCDFSSSSYPVLSRNSSRFDLVGAGIHSSVINYTGSISAINFLGNINWSAHGTNSAMSLKDFCVYGPDGKTGTGVRLTGLAHMRVESIRTARCAIGLRISECLSNTFEKLYIDNNINGVVIDGDALNNNATKLSGNFSNNTTYAIDGSVGTEFTISDSIFEHNGTSGSEITGDIRLRVNQPMGVINISNCYFGFSNGGASIRIDNLTAGVIIVNISKCMFTRGINADGVTANIAIGSSGGGLVILNLDGNMFYTNTTFGYVPSSSKPFINDGGVSIINGIDSCFFNEQISKKPTAIGSSSNILAGTVYDNGTGSHPIVLSSTRISAGVYKITSTIPLSNAITGYQVTCMSQGTTVRPAYIEKQSEAAFTVTMHNTSGTPSDATFDYQITRTR